MTPADLDALRGPLAEWLGLQHADASEVTLSKLALASGGYSAITLPQASSMDLNNGAAVVLAKRAAHFSF